MVLNIAERSVLAPGSARVPYTASWVGCRGADLGGRAGLGGVPGRPGGGTWAAWGGTWAAWGGYLGGLGGVPWGGSKKPVFLGANFGVFGPPQG